MTNGDRVRQLPNPELAEVIMCPYYTEPDLCNSTVGCLECCRNWLDKEFEEESGGEHD